MANNNGWGDGAGNNAIGWGQAANNAISWGKSHSLSYAGLTDIVGTAAVTPLLLDTYTGASVAYSLRKLRAAYTGNAIRVRRSSDNLEQDIAFIGNVLDTVSLLTFCGAGNGFVTTWYDQSVSNNLAQTTAINQPQIVSSGALITRGGKPYIEAISTRFFRLGTNLTAAINTNYSYWMTYEKNATGNTPVLLSDGSNFHWLDYGVLQYVNATNTMTLLAGDVFAINTNYLTNVITNYSVGATQYRNGVQIGTRGALTAAAVTTFIPSNLGRTAKITFAEFIYYPSNETTNRAAITTDINSYYTIY